MNVPLLDLRAQYAAIQAELETAALHVLRETRYILGPEVGGLEQDLQTYLGVRHVIGCASGSDALLLALLALGIGPGDEIITTPYTFFATVSAIVRVGATPVFVDIDPRTYNIDSRAVAAKVTARTRAILPVHLFGQCAELDPLRQLGVPVIEDAAQAIGATYQGRPAGTLGLLGAFSFFPTKNLGGAGDGGAVSTNDDALAAKLRVLRVHGAEPKYYHHVLGINSRLDTLQAAILRVKLPHLADWTARRQQNAARYDTRFRELGLTNISPPRRGGGGFRSPPPEGPGEGSGIVLPFRHPDATHIFNQYTICVAGRDALRANLQQAGISTEIYYPVPLHLQECFASLGHRPGDFPVAERTAAESLALPIYPELTAEMIDYVAETVARLVKQNSP